MKGPFLDHSGFCQAHRKVLHRSRKAARRASRLMAEPGIRGRCDQVDGMWHVGHLPAQVRRGEKAMRETRP